MHNTKIFYIISIFLAATVFTCLSPACRQRGQAALSPALSPADTCTGHHTWYNKLFHPDDYVRACYRYGRQLREQGDCGCSTDYVAAMQVFLDGTRAEYLCRPVKNPLLTDHATLGRIYSNMGTMCHLEGSFPLAYDMYKHCAEQFLLAGDSTMYYYALNATALQQAEQNLFHEALSMLDSISANCSDANVIAKTWETKSILYVRKEQYDSALFAVNKLMSYGDCNTITYMIKAQCFSFTHRHDSAVYYAKIVAQKSQSLGEKNNSYYILANEDSTISLDTRQQIHADRADIHKQIEIRQGNLSHAVALLQQEQDDKPHYIRLILFVAALLLLSSLSYYAKIRIRNHKRLVFEDIAIEERRMRDDIKEKEDKLLSQTKQEKQRQETLQKQQAMLMQENESIQKKSEAIIRNYNNMRKQILKEAETVCDAIRGSEDWQKEISWNDYDKLHEKVNKYFFLLADKLHTKHNLDEKEFRLCVLMLLGGFSNKQIAEILIYSTSGIGTFKYRLSQKFGVQTKDMREYLLNLIVLGAFSKAES